MKEPPAFRAPTPASAVLGAAAAHGDVSPQSSTLNPLPLSIPDHELLRPIGRGSYGEVWLARNVLGQPRAVKIVHRSSFDDDRPFQREFDGLQKFEPISRSHPSQLAILHVGRREDTGCFYYVMELADDAGNKGIGGVVDSCIDEPTPAGHQSTNPPIQHPASYTPRTLKLEMKRRSRLPPAECVTLGLSLAQALAHLHAHHLVHRDIKPSNIIFVSGVPKLADIGLVTDMDASRSFVGTEGYLPPEGPGTPPADIYSLGKVLYELCTGKDRKEYPALPPDLRERPASEQRELLELNAVLVKACATDPPERYQSAEKLAADLELLQRGKSVKTRRAVQRRLAVAKRLATAAATLALVAAVGWLLANRFNDSTSERFIAANAEVNSLAVLPFDNESPDKADEYLSTQVAEELSGALTKIPELRVLGRSTALALKQAKDRRQVARDLNLGAVLDGRLQKSSNHLRLSVQLITPRNDAVLWSEIYVGEMEDAFGIQSDIAEKVAQAAAVRLTETAKYRLALKPTQNWEAYQLFLEARYWWGRRTVASVKRAAALFERATMLDTNFARAYAGLADCYSVMPDLGAGPTREAWPMAKAAATKAVELDGKLAETQTSLGMAKRYVDWDWAGAEKAFQRAIELDPSYPTARQWYAQLLNSLQRPDEAIAQIKKAVELDPQSDHLLWNLVLRYCYARQFDRAVETWRQVLQLDAEKPRGYKMLWVFERTGHEEEAVPLWERQFAGAATQAELEALRNARAVVGMKVYWEKQLEFALRRAEKSPDAWSYDVAHLYAYLGKNAQTLDWLERAYKERSPFMTYLGVDPIYDPLRSEPRFIALIKNVGLEMPVSKK